MIVPVEFQVAARADRDAMSDEWIGGYHLGAGGEGVVNLWVRVNRNGKIRQTLAIKDERSVLSPGEPQAYQGFYEDLVAKNMDLGVSQIHPSGEAKPYERFHKEAYVQGLLTAGPDEPRTDTVPLGGYKTRRVPSQASDLRNYTYWRLFMKYYAFGDLHDLIKRHMQMEMAIPEPFIWWTFFCLASACRQMETRVQERANGKFKYLEEVIVAFDMKPLNVLLGPPGGDRFPAYPRPMVSDFGGAQVTHWLDPYNNNGRLMGAHTPGWRPPEITSKDFGDGLSMKACLALKLSWTNMWQVGRIIECMMRLTTGMMEPDYWSNIDEDKESYLLVGELPRQYSDELRRLVWSCQRFTPQKRSTPEQVVQAIEDNRHLWEEMESWGTPEWFEKYKGDEEKKRKQEKDDEEDSGPTKKKKKSGDSSEAKPDMGFVESWKAEQRNAAWELYEEGVYVPEGCDLVYRGDEGHWKRGTAMFDEDKKLLRPLGYRMKDEVAELTTEGYAEAYGSLAARKRRIERGMAKGSDEEVVKRREEEIAAEEEMERASLSRKRKEEEAARELERVEELRRKAEAQAGYEPTEEDSDDGEVGIAWADDGSKDTEDVEMDDAGHLEEEGEMHDDAEDEDYEDDGEDEDYDEELMEV